MTQDDLLAAFELELLTSSTRRDPSRTRQLLHEDFVEIGRSGRRWTRDDIVESLRREDQRPTPVVDEWRSEQVALDLVLVTYRLRTDDAISRHSSLWDTSARSPKLRFHQGTVVADPDETLSHWS